MFIINFGNRRDLYYVQDTYMYTYKSRDRRCFEYSLLEGNALQYKYQPSHCLTNLVVASFIKIEKNSWN